MLKQFIFAVIVISIGAPAFGSDSTGTLKGKVIDAVDGKPVHSASVCIPKANRTGKVSETGHFELHGLEPNIYTVLIDRFGYERYELDSIAILPDSVTFLNMRLERDGEFAVQAPKVTAIHHSSTSQTPRISGRVTNAGTGEAVGRAVIRIRNRYEHEVTDDVGFFSFDALGNGKYDLSIEKDFFFTERLTGICVDDSTDFALNLILCPTWEQYDWRGHPLVVMGYDYGPGTFCISGHLLDTKTGKPVESANVTLVSLGWNRITDSLGWFSFCYLVPHRHVISVSHPDYSSVLTPWIDLEYGSGVFLELGLTQVRGHSED